MPLEAGAKPGSPGFGRNVATEVRAGKPVKQAAAIAYAKARGDTDITSTFVSPAQMAEGQPRLDALRQRADLLHRRADAGLRADDLRGDAEVRYLPDYANEGRRAAAAGKERASNPYKEGTSAAFSWAKGYSAHKDLERERKSRGDADTDIRDDGWRRRQGDLKKGKGRRDAEEKVERYTNAMNGDQRYRVKLPSGGYKSFGLREHAEKFLKELQQKRSDTSPDPIAGYGPDDMLETKGDAGPGRREREAAFGWDPKWGKQPYDQHVRQNLMNDVPAVKEQTRQRRSEHSYVKAELKAGRRPYGDSLTAKLDALVERADDGKKLLKQKRLDGISHEENIRKLRQLAQKARSEGREAVARQLEGAAKTSEDFESRLRSAGIKLIKPNKNDKKDSLTAKLDALVERADARDKLTERRLRQMDPQKLNDLKGSDLSSEEMTLVSEET